MKSIAYGALFGAVVALVANALFAHAQITQPVGTLQPKHQPPPVIALLVGDTSSMTETRAPFDTVLKATGSRFVCTKAGIGYTIRKDNRSANRKTTAVYVDTIVRWCFPAGTIIPKMPRGVTSTDTTQSPNARRGRPDTMIARMGAESRKAVAAESADTTKPVRKPPR